jgi:hypothetical protein
MKRVQTKLTWKFAWIPVVVLALVIFGILFGITGDLARSVSATAIIVGLLCAFLAYALAIIGIAVGIHEVSHALAGWSVRFKLYAFRIGNCELSRMSTGWRIRKAPVPLTVAGAVLETTEDLRNILPRYRWMVFGGPLGSLLFGLMLIKLWSGFGLDANDSEWLFRPGVAHQLLMHIPLHLGVISALFGAEILVPIKYGRVASDSLQLLMTFTKKKEVELGLVYNMIGIPWTYGVGASNWNKEAIDHLLAKAEQPNLRASANLLAYYYQAAKGDYPAALFHMSVALQAIRDGDLMGNPAAAPALLEGAYALAYYQHKASDARKLLIAAGPPPEGKYSSFYRAEGAVLWSEGNAEDARKVIDLGEALLVQENPLPMQDNMVVEREMLRRVVDHPLASPMSLSG